MGRCIQSDTVSLRPTKSTRKITMASSLTLALLVAACLMAQSSAYFFGGYGGYGYGLAGGFGGYGGYCLGLWGAGLGYGYPGLGLGYGYGLGGYGLGLGVGLAPAIGIAPVGLGIGIGKAY